MSAFRFLALCITITFGATPSQWKSRSIYQLLTDRFAKTSGSSSACNDLSKYCGGTFKGIQNHLSYIQKLGFDAIWISPVVANTPNGYHGYWAQDFYSINPNYGTESDLISLANALHSKGMYLMIDVVANHVGIPPNNDITKINPFNSWNDYHSCNVCPSSCNIENWNDQNQVELCRLSGLPDLNQSNPTVASQLTSWVTNYVIKKWKADGIRIDTVPEVNKNFWKSFQQAAGVYAVGEVDNGNPSYDGPYQQVIDGILSYPMFYTIRDVFGSGKGMTQIDSRISDDQKNFKDVSLLATFVDNHDNDRFLCDYHPANGNYHRKYINALTFALTFTGIPITYYGSEQAFAGHNGGCSDPNNRQSLWQTGFNANGTDIGGALTVVNNARKKESIWNSQFVKRAGSNNFYAYTRGSNFFVALTNGGYSSGQVKYTVNSPGLKSGTKYCNVFWPAADCFSYSGGSQDIYLNNGECKVYIPSSKIEAEFQHFNVFEHTERYFAHDASYTTMFE
eukprot:382831_1